jgi:hypothetical protein
MHLIAVLGCIGLLEGVLLQDFNFVVSALTTFKIFEAAV